MYTAFFSCTLVPQDYALFSSDTFWSFALLAVGFIGGLALIAHRFLLKTSTLVIGCAFMAIGVIAIRYAFNSPEHYQIIYSISAFVAGLGFGVMILHWYRAIRSLSEDRVEFAIPAAFALSFAVYYLVFAFKGSVSVYFIAFLPLVSLACLRRIQNGCDLNKPKELRAQKVKVRPLLGTLCLFLLAWINFGFFRIFAAPDYTSDRTLYYLIPFCISLFATLVIVLVSLRNVSFISISSAFRWAIALICIGYTVLFLNPYDDGIKLAGYAINFTAMFTVQIATFIVLPKLATRLEADLTRIAPFFLIAEGFGVFVGVHFAKLLFEVYAFSIHPAWCFLVISILVGAAMLVGLSPEHKFVFKRKREIQGNHEHDLDNLQQINAQILALEYNLSPRETDILGRLLLGHSRPKIRDELFISLNTVNVHVRNVYSKTDVHSQQELILLARKHELQNTEAEDTSLFALP